MSRIKKWQCPHCSLSCSRRWNLVVHIRRNHGGVGQPIDEQNSGGAETPLLQISTEHILTGDLLRLTILIAVL